MYLFIKIALYLIIISGSFFAFFKYGFRSVFLLPVFVVIFDVIIAFYPIGSGFGTLRNSIFLILIIFLSIKNKRLLSINIWIIIFFIYVLILIMLSSDKKTSFANYISALVSMLSFPIGFCYTRNIKDLKIINFSMIAAAIIFIANNILCLLLGIGLDAYGGMYTIGGFVGSRMFSAAIFLILLPLILPLNTSRINKLIIALSTVVFIFIFLSMRRTSVFIIVFGYILYFFFSKKKVMLIATSITFLLLVILLYPLYKNSLIRQLQARSEIYENPSIENEARYKETFIIIKETFSNIKTSLIGKEAFNSAGNYNKGKWGERPLHIDYNVILHGTGLIGLILYVLIFIDIYRKYLMYAKYIPDETYFHELKAIFKIMFILTLIVALNGGIFSVSYRTIIFLYLGSILGIFNKYYKYRDQQI